MKVEDLRPRFFALWLHKKGYMAEYLLRQSPEEVYLSQNYAHEYFEIVIIPGDVVPLKIFLKLWILVYKILKLGRRNLCTVAILLGLNGGCSIATIEGRYLTKNLTLLEAFNYALPLMLL